MISYIIYLAVIILVLYIYFIRTYPSNAGIFLNKEIISGKKEKIISSDLMPKPMHMNSTLSVWMKYDNVNYRRGEQKYVLTKGNKSDSLQMPSIILDKRLNKLVVVVDYIIHRGGIEKIEKKIKIDYDIPIAKWFNITIVTKSGEIQAYINGKLKKSIIVSGYPKYNNEDMMINFEKGFDGYIRNIQYYDTELSSDNIRKLYYMGPLYDGTVSFIAFLFASLFLPLKYFGKFLVNLLAKLNLNALLGINIKAAICDKNTNE